MEPITDVVPEQVAAGDAEPAPTPAVGDPIVQTEEVDAPGGLEKLDEKVELVKEAVEGTLLENEAKDETMGGEPKAVEIDAVRSGMEEPRVEESRKEEEPVIETPAALESNEPGMEGREQERLENPVYTLEIVGNRYNPSNFW